MITRNSMARAAAVAVAGALWLGAATAHAAPVRLAGTDVVGSHVSAASPGGAEVYRTTAAAGGTVSSLSLHLDASSAGDRARTRPVRRRGWATDHAADVRSRERPDRRLEPGRRPGGGTRGGQGVLDRAAEPRRRRPASCAGRTAPARVIRANRAAATPDLTTLPDTWVTGGIYGDGPLSAYALGEAARADADGHALRPELLGHARRRQPGGEDAVAVGGSLALQPRRRTRRG